jgi:hypothetical protein
MTEIEYWKANCWTCIICNNHKCDECSVVDYLQYRIDKKKDELKQYTESKKKRYVQFI